MWPERSLFNKLTRTVILVMFGTSSCESAPFTVKRWCHQCQGPTVHIYLSEYVWHSWVKTAQELGCFSPVWSQQSKVSCVVRDFLSDLREKRENCTNKEWRLVPTTSPLTAVNYFHHVIEMTLWDCMHARSTWLNMDCLQQSNNSLWTNWSQKYIVRHSIIFQVRLSLC